MLNTSAVTFLIVSALSVASFASDRAIHITVNGMVCGFCAQGITKKFSSEPGVEKVNVSLEKKTVDLGLKSGQDVTDETIRRVLTEAGYAIEKIERN